MKKRILAWLLVSMFLTGFVACADKEDDKGSDSVADSVADSKAEGETVDYTTFTLKYRDNGDGTGTVDITIPAGIGNGKVCLKTSDKLNYIEGSANTGMEGLVIVEDDDPAGEGLSVLFATATVFPANALALTADFTVADGAEITAADLIVPYWEIGDGTVMLATSKNGDVIKIIE